uniref:FAD-dependent 5-carboxymethylaminomethyl-2-thiouridine(34) oxidoreductase MnmC n=1 Tax=uncultured Acidovorax sp. TaxID=158751 RepID=UPI0025D69295
PCIVIGGGIAGAAAAASLARRGWQVQVLDQAAEPAAGASALPAGVFAPHVSPDDSVLSRLSRSGIRTTLEQARWLLNEGVDWAHSGVLEHRTDGSPGLSPDWTQGPGAAWSEPAPSAALTAAQLPPDATACWHHQAGWVRPARLARALLGQPGIQWRGNCAVAQLRRVEAPSTAHGPATTTWQALDAQGQVLAEAPTVVIAAGAGSLALLNHRWPLQPVRGQVSWGKHADPAKPLLPWIPFPANGNGNLVPRFPLGDQADDDQGWVMGSTFERDVQALPPTDADIHAAHATNWAKLQGLLPGIAPQLEPLFAQALNAPALQPAAGEPPALRTWAAVRCTAPDRLPIVGPVDAAQLPGLWTSTAMGARGLTLALLCGELLAARLQGEPLPLDARLAKALGTERLQ